jgi:hypothetical protein
MTKSNTNQSARIIPGTASLLLAAVVALEVTGMSALSHGHDRWMTASTANGDIVYTQVEGTGSAASDVVAQASY